MADLAAGHVVEPDAAQWRQTSRPDYDLQTGGTAISTNITGVMRMPSIETRGAVAGDVTTPVKLRLSSLWVSVMLRYIYGDIFSFFKPGTLKDILAGDTGAFGSRGGLLAAAILMAIPSVMVFLSLALKPRISRYANIVLGSRLHRGHRIDHSRCLGILPVPGRGGGDAELDDRLERLEMAGVMPGAGCTSSLMRAMTVAVR